MLNFSEASGSVLLLLWVLFVFIVVVVVRRAVTAVLLALGIVPGVWGMALTANASSYEGQVFVPFLLGSVALLAGCVAVSKGRGVVFSKKVDDMAVDWALAAPCLVGMAVFGTALHFYLTGIPILGSNVEVQRFARGSALFGFPSRMHQFGLPLSAAAAMAQARSMGVLATKHSLTRVAFGVMVLAGLLSGFKSGLTAVVVTAILLAGATGSTIDVRPGMAVKIVVAVLMSVLFAFWVASHYGTYANRSITAVLQDRILRGSAEAPETVLQARTSRRFGSSSLRTDARYFGEKYFGIATDGGTFAFQEQVSSAVTHTPLRRDQFLVPVTTTAVADAIYDLGLFLGLVAMAALGYTIQRAQHEATRSTARPYRFLAYAALLLGGYTYVIKGGLVHLVVNWSLVYLLFASVCWLTVGGTTGATVITKFRARHRTPGKAGSPGFVQSSAGNETETGVRAGLTHSATHTL